MRVILTIVAFATMVGCASTEGYFVDRGRDAADVLTLTVGRGVGVKAKIGPIQTGLIMNEDVFGLRCGEISCWPAFSAIHPEKWGGPSGRPSEALLPLPVIFNPDLGLHGGGEQYKARSLAETRGKAFLALNMIPFFPTAVTMKPEGETSWSYYTQVEAVLALGPSIRAGFNPAELLDFILGLLTIDIFNDDLEWKKRKSKVP